MLADEQKLKDFLFKEADNKKEHRKKIAIHEFLFAEVEDFQKILEDDEHLEKEGMARQSGVSNLKNSGWNTNWDFVNPNFNKVRGEVAKKSGNLFASLRGQVQPDANSFDLRPGPLAFYFRYYRTIIPEKNKEAAGKANNAVDEVNKILNGFSEFKHDIQTWNIPLNPYFMVSEFTGNDGRVDNSLIPNFINKELNRQLISPPTPENPQGTPIQSASHYQKHANSAGPIEITKYLKKTQLFPMNQIDTATKSMLKDGIVDRMSSKNRYVLKIDTINPNDEQEKSLDRDIRMMYINRMNKNKMDASNPDHEQFLNYYMILFDKIHDWWETDRSSDGLKSFDTFGLKLILKHMVHTGGTQPETPPDQFSASIRIAYLSNGWDSCPNDPSREMLTFPPLRQLPKGEIIYDRGNGNMGYDHLMDWQLGLGKLFEKWGSHCKEWLNLLQGEQGYQIVQSSPEAAAAWENVLSSQSGNRTGAENLLDLFNEYPTWQDFQSNHLEKSLASEIKAVNNLWDNEITTEYFGREGEFSQLMNQVKNLAQTILQTGQNDPEKSQTQLDYLSTELIQRYKNETMTWKELTMALQALNTPIASSNIRRPEMKEDPNHNNAIKATEGSGTERPLIPTGKNVRVNNGLTVRSVNSYKKMIDEGVSATENTPATGFHLLQQYGYHVAKMMDFLSAIMYRSCHEKVGLENRFGHQYATSSGISKGGEISLTVIYEKLMAEASNDIETQSVKVDVYEKLAFDLSQRSGSNEEPIMLELSLPWEQMVDIFNERYPEAGYEFDAVSGPITGYLAELETNIKQAINKASGDIKVIYHNSDNEVFELSNRELSYEEVSNKNEYDNNVIEDEMETQETQPEQDEWTPETQGPEFPIPTPEAPAVPDTSNVPVTFTTNDNETQDPINVQSPKPMPILHDPASKAIQKKDTKKRRLLRQNAGLGSIEERLQKAANKLDECHEFKVADKIDLLLTKIHKEPNVRKTSNI